MDYYYYSTTTTPMYIWNSNIKVICLECSRMLKTHPKNVKSKLKTFAAQSCSARGNAFAVAFLPLKFSRSTVQHVRRVASYRDMKRIKKNLEREQGPRERERERTLSRKRGEKKKKMLSRREIDSLKACTRRNLVCIWSLTRRIAFLGEDSLGGPVIGCAREKETRVY